MSDPHPWWQDRKVPLTNEGPWHQQLSRTTNGGHHNYIWSASVSALLRILFNSPGSLILLHLHSLKTIHRTKSNNNRKELVIEMSAQTDAWLVIVHVSEWFGMGLVYDVGDQRATGQMLQSSSMGLLSSWASSPSSSSPEPIRLFNRFPITKKSNQNLIF